MMTLRIMAVLCHVVSFTLSVTNKAFILSVVLLNVVVPKTILLGVVIN
jgi:hypothetical protein